MGGQHSPGAEELTSEAQWAIFITRRAGRCRTASTRGGLADRIEQRLVADHVGDSDRAFIEAADMFFLATVDENGQPSCSYKGGAPGFVRVVDPRTLAFPNYDGNGMFLSMGNIAQSRKVGMLFIDFERPRRMRLSGEARISDDDPLLADYPEAQFIVRVAVTQVFPNCPRYIHQYRLVERSTYVPKAGQRDADSELEEKRLGLRRAAGKGPGARLAQRLAGRRAAAAYRTSSPCFLCQSTIDSFGYSRKCLWPRPFGTSDQGAAKSSMIDTSSGGLGNGVSIADANG